jgi:hypothetical protein
MYADSLWAFAHHKNGHPVQRSRHDPILLHGSALREECTPVFLNNSQGAGYCVSSTHTLRTIVVKTSRSQVRRHWRPHVIESRHVDLCTTGGRLSRASGLVVASETASRDCRYDYVRFWGVLIRSARCLPSNSSGCRWNRWFHPCFFDEKTA